MFHRKKPDHADHRTSLIAHGTVISGNLTFTGPLYLQGQLQGELSSGDADAVLTLGEHGDVQGDIRVPFAIIHGHVRGDIHATHRLELAATARVTGNIHYTTLVLTVGAQVNGHMRHGADMAAMEPPAQAPADPDPHADTAADADASIASSPGPAETRRERRRRRARHPAC
ncbi:bactofilin family protein [Dyella telluris]|uniref:Polymer-forming cytoskeletal protein n=1 Tax=Dyella telluris TaxID=2763498 RepID=A0A7G8Q106_9GAMM|nr:polymer-forming cytoskeletal protein [Dyella telluris]QNK00464.1 polymer-forming cytoskeletal protein [Dyella telluris]